MDLQYRLFISNDIRAFNVPSRDNFVGFNSILIYSLLKDGETRDFSSHPKRSNFIDVFPDEWFFSCATLSRLSRV